MADPDTLLHMGDSITDLAKELIETDREVEIIIENHTSDLTLGIGPRYNARNTELLSTAMDVGPKQEEGLVFSKKKGAWTGCWGYQAFTLESKSVDLSDAYFVVFFAVPADLTLYNMFYGFIRTIGKIEFNEKTAYDFYYSSMRSETGTRSWDYHGYTFKLQMSDGKAAKLHFWITQKEQGKHISKGGKGAAK